MIALILSAALGQWSPQPPGMLQFDPGAQCQRTGGRCFLNRTGNRPRNDYAFFEFAPASGAGMGTACACTTPTGAKGEAMTLTRAGAATCYPLGFATTGIANASLVECAGNLPRIEVSGGNLALLLELARVNVLTRFIDYANATWADVGTPTLTGAQASPFTGTYANLAVQFDDNDAVAFEGRTQTVTVTAATQYTMSCLVKAGTLSSWSLSLDGTTASGTGLSSTTWSLVTVTDASSSGVAIAAQALNGSTAAATGTVIWGGCQVEAGAIATSMIPTVAAGVARAAEIPTVPLAVSAVTTGSMAVSVELQTTATNGLLSATAAGAFRQSIITFGGSRAYVGGVSLVGPLAALTSGGVRRAAMWWDGASTNLILNGTPTAGAAGTPAATDALQIGNYDGTAGTLEGGLYSLICYDLTSSRCR